MPFTHIYAPDPLLVGEAAFQAGYGRYVQEERERQRQAQEFQAKFGLEQQEMAMRQQQLADQQAEDQWKRRLAEAEFREGNQRFDRGLWNEQQQRRAQFGLGAQQADLQLRNRLAEQQAGAELEAQQWQQQLPWEQEKVRQQQQALMGRTEATIEGRANVARRNQIANQMMQEWNAILEHAPNMKPEQWKAVVDAFRDKYEGLGMEPPVEMEQPTNVPQTPDDPELQAIRQSDPKGTYWRKPNGDIGSVPFNKTGEAWEQEQQRKRDEAAARETEKERASEEKRIADYNASRQKHNAAMAAAYGKSWIKSAGETAPKFHPEIFEPMQEFLEQEWVTRWGTEPPSFRPGGAPPAAAAPAAPAAPPPVTPPMPPPAPPTAAPLPLAPKTGGPQYVPLGKDELFPANTKAGDIFVDKQDPTIGYYVTGKGKDANSSNYKTLRIARTDEDVQKMFASNTIKVGDYFIAPNGSLRQRTK
jgi:hypothetical protein